MTENIIDTFIAIENAAHTGAFGDNKQAIPTDAQAIAGNYKLGRATIYGLPVAIEQPRNSYRTGLDQITGKRWANRLAAHYGYFSGTKGADGDGVDCFIGFYPQSEHVYIINQFIAGSFDEHKVMLCFPDEEAATRAYLDSYDKSWNGLQSIIKSSVTQFKWWLKNGNMNNEIALNHLPFEGLETMRQQVAWDSAANPIGTALHKVLYEIQRADSGENLIFDAVCMRDILENAESIMALDAMVTPYSKLQRKMEILQKIMERTGDTIKPLAVQISDPFKQSGVAQVAVIFELSDGQTVSVFFHNPDVDPRKIQQSDELISWKWLLNKKDITIVVAPERGQDLNIKAVAERIMRLADKNSAAFIRANSKRAEKMQAIEGIKTEIVGLEAELKAVQHELEVAKVEAEDLAANSVNPVIESDPVIDPDTTEINDITKNVIALSQLSFDDFSKKVKGSKHTINDSFGKAIRAKTARGGDGQLQYQYSANVQVNEGYLSANSSWLGDETIKQVKRNLYEQVKKYVDNLTQQSREPNEQENQQTEITPQAEEAGAEASELDPTSPEGYAKIKGIGNMELRYQDDLDTFFQARIVDIRAALSNLGWVHSVGENGYGLSMTKSTFIVRFDFSYVGAIKNVVGVSFKINPIGFDVAETIQDDLAKTPEQLAADIDAATIAEVKVDQGQDEESKVELTGNELGEFPDTEDKKALRSAAIDFYDNELIGKGVLNISLEKMVEFDKEGRDKVKSFSADPRKLHLVHAMLSIVANGRPTPASPVKPHDRAAMKGVKLVHILKTPVILNGENIKVRFLVHEKEDGHLFYDHSVDNSEVVTVMGGSGGVMDSADAADLNLSVLLPGEPPSGHHCIDSISNDSESFKNISLDSASNKMVFNLFIEGEEPEVIVEDADDEAEVKQDLIDAKAEFIKSGKEQLANMPEDATLEQKAKAVFAAKGIEGYAGERIIAAIREKDVESLRSMLGNTDNKASRTVFEIATGIKLEKTAKGTLPQIDEWAGIMPEQRAAIEAEKQAVRDADNLLSDLKYAWIPLEYAKVDLGHGVEQSMQEWLIATYGTGFTHIETRKRGASIMYLMANKQNKAQGFSRSKVFNTFLKAALAFGEGDNLLSMKKALKALGIDAAEQELTPVESVNAAYAFKAADDFKEWLAESIDKAEYSPFLTAKAMDEAAKRNGADIEWGFFGGVALDSVGLAINELENILYIVENNEPINRAKGNIDQANLESEVAGSIKEAIETLSDAEPDSTAGDEETLKDIDELYQEPVSWLGFKLVNEEMVRQQSSSVLPSIEQISGDVYLGITDTKNGGDLFVAGTIVGIKFTAMKVLYTVAVAVAPQPKEGVNIYAIIPDVDSIAIRPRNYLELESNTLDSVSQEALLQIKNSAIFDSTSLDGVEQDGYVGKITKDGAVVGRIDIGDDGKALVFVGDSGDTMVRFKSQVDGELLDYMYSDSDAAEMVDSLFNVPQAEIKADQTALTLDKINDAIKPIFNKIGDAAQESRRYDVTYQTTDKSGFHVVFVGRKGADAGETYKLSVSEIQADKASLFLNMTQHKSKYDDVQNGRVIQSSLIKFDGTQSGLSAAISAKEGDALSYLGISFVIPEVNYETATQEQATESMKYLRGFIGQSQLNAIATAMRGEEKQFFFDKVVALEKQIKDMPKTYDQDGMGNKAIAYLHYFKGGMDWYITERDMEDEQLQAFGFANLGDMQNAEMGYISIEELIKSGVELDLYWIQKTIGEIKGNDDAEEETAVDPEPKTEEILPEIVPSIEEPAQVIVTGNTELDKQRAKLQSLAALQERMKAANKIIKSKTLTDEQKKDQLTAAGEDYYRLMKPDFAGRIGYADYLLTNNNAVIRSTQKRIEQLEAQALAENLAASGDRETSYDFDGGVIDLDYGDDRLRVRFDKKPDPDMIAKLKQNGFKWSPTNTAWQRQLTDNAISTANYLFGTKIQTAASAMNEEMNKPRGDVIVPAASESATEQQENPMKAAFEAELDALKAETSIEALDRKLDEIAGRIEGAGLMEELDGKLNEVADILTGLLAEAEKAA